MKPSVCRLSIPILHLCVALVLGPLVGSPLSAATFKVGSDGACTHATIGAALVAALAAGADEIRIAQNQTYTNVSLHLTDWSPATVGPLTLVGGFPTCAAATPSGWTELLGQAGNPVIDVDTASQATSQVTLRGLQIKGGLEGLRVDGGGRVSVDASRLVSNVGSGAVVSNGGELTLTVDNEVAFNSNTGVACFTGSLVNSAAHIHDNDATGGGGVSAGSGCEVNLLPQSWVINNQATVGAGIYASSGASVLVDGVLSGGLGTLVNSNDAVDQGGGIYATGAGTTVTVRNAQVDSNVAGLEGGGLWAGLGAKIVLDRVTGGCFNPARCSSLSNNQVTQGNSAVPGAAAWAESGADIEIYQTFVEGNSVSATSDNGSVLYATGAGSTLTVEGLQLWNNLEADALFEGASGAHVQIAFVTASRNVHNGSPVTSPLALSGGSTATVNSSIFYPNLPFIVLDSSSISEVDCVIVSNTTGIGGSFVVTSDPLFVGSTVGNLRLQLASPAIDFCDTAQYVPQHDDRDHEARGFDLAVNANGSPGVSGGIYDLGMDEVRPLFADGFGTGSASAWSTVVP